MRSLSGFGFEYIQGSGDDEDFWAQVRLIQISILSPAKRLFERQGLKPKVFHQNRERLLSTPKQDLPEVIAEVKASSAQNTTTPNSSHLSATTEIPPNSGLLLGVTSAKDVLDSSKKRLVLQLSRSTVEELSSPAQNADHLFYRIPKSKKGEMYYVNTVLPACADAACSAIGEGNEVLVIDDDGKDVSVGVMVALSWLVIDDDGNRRSGPAPTGKSSVASGFTGSCSGVVK